MSTPTDTPTAPARPVPWTFPPAPAWEGDIAAMVATYEGVDPQTGRHTVSFGDGAGGYWAVVTVRQAPSSTGLMREWQVIDVSGGPVGPDDYEFIAAADECLTAAGVNVYDVP
jgi:hypothetical protein